MKKASTFFLRTVIIGMGAVVLGLCVFVLPLGIMTDHTGMYKPILLGMYVPAIPFFIALWETLKLLKYIDADTAFSEHSVVSLKRIKQCGKVISILYALGMPYIFHVADKDDAPGVVLIGVVIVFASLSVAVFAAVLERLLQNAIEIKRENDLTV